MKIRGMTNTSSFSATSPTPTIEWVETFLLDLPTIRPHRLSVGTMSSQTLMIVRMHCSDGVVGIGEGTTIAGLAYGPESPEGMKLAIDTYVAPVLCGADATQVQSLMLRIGNFVKGNRFAKCAVETALFDAQARRLGVPLSELFGGRVRAQLPVAWTLASGDTARDIGEAEEMLSRQRHNVFKLKIGRHSVQQDVAHVAAIKRSVGDCAKVRVDVNMAWSETDAARGLPALADVGCELAEQPVASIAAMGRLMRRFPIALMADEVLQGPETAFEVACGAAADVFAVKIEQAGGLLAAWRLAAIADAAGIELYGGTMLEGPIGTIASAHLFSTFPNLQWGTELFGPLLLTEEILCEPLQYDNFGLQVPKGVGLGVSLDEARVTEFRRDRDRVMISIPAEIKAG